MQTQEENLNPKPQTMWGGSSGSNTTSGFGGMGGGGTNSFGGSGFGGGTSTLGGSTSSFGGGGTSLGNTSSFGGLNSGMGGGMGGGMGMGGGGGGNPNNDKELTGFTDTPSSLAWSPMNFLASGCWDNHVRSYLLNLHNNNNNNINRYTFTKFNNKVRW